MILKRDIHILLSFIFFLFHPLITNGTLSLDSVTTLNYKVPSTNSNLAYAVDKYGNTWVRGNIDDSLLNKDLLFQNRSIHIMDYEVYAYQNDVLQVLQKNIDHNNEQIKSRYPIYHIKPSIGTYYLNIKRNPPYKLNITINEYTKFGEDVSLLVLYFSMYYGLILTSIIFNFVFYLIFRDRRFISYILLQIFIFLTFFYEDGMFYYFSNQTWVLPYFAIWNASFASIMAAVFSYYFLELRQYMPSFKRIIIIFGSIILVATSLFTMTDYEGLRYIAIALCFALPLIALHQAGKMLKHSVYARFLLLNFGILVFVAVLYVINKRYNIPFLSLFNFFTLRLVSAFEIVAISFALIFKVRTLREEKARYKTELKHYLELLKLDQQIAYEKSRSKDTLVDDNKDYSEEGLLNKIRDEYKLTEREVEVLIGIWNGYSNKEIADNLYISVNTTKFHVGRLYTKMDVKNRSEARQFRQRLD